MYPGHVRGGQGISPLIHGLGRMLVRFHLPVCVIISLSQFTRLADYSTWVFKWFGFPGSVKSGTRQSWHHYSSWDCQYLRAALWWESGARLGWQGRWGEGRRRRTGRRWGWRRSWGESVAWTNLLMYTCSIAPYVHVMGRLLVFSKRHCSLLPRSHALPGEIQSSERSWISWAYS